jgi:glutamate-1-semialdehyde 2,1-aminomutase
VAEIERFEVSLDASIPLVDFHTGLNPGSPPPSDLVLLDAKVRSTAEKGNAYRAWLHQLKKVCNGSDVPLLFDEVYTGFRMAPGGAQEYYGVDADVVVYGKTLGGGLANGVVLCGIQPLVWVVLTKLENSLARSNRRRFG